MCNLVILSVQLYKREHLLSLIIYRIVLLNITTSTVSNVIAFLVSKNDNAEISVSREKATSSEPGFVLSSFSEREIMTLSKGLHGPILTPSAL